MMIKTFSGIILISNILFYSLIFTGCSVIGTFTPDNESNVIILKFHDRKDIIKYCPEGAVGCTEIGSNVYTIHSVREWCTLNHEIAHVIKGDYHVKGATCKTLPI